MGLHKSGTLIGALLNDKFIKTTILTVIPLLVAGSIVLYLYLPGFRKSSPTATTQGWTAPDIYTLPVNESNNLIRYGEALVSHTALFLGPKGSVARLSNGMNCQNCHLDAGTRAYGNSFALVASGYPKFRERSGRVETIAFRINDCMERSLNGSPLDTQSREMQAMIAYISWIGKGLDKKQQPPGTGMNKIPWLNRAADPDKGQKVYIAQCQRCHGDQGGGLPNYDSSNYKYPPLWGNRSFNTSAGMYRISQLAGFIRYNMPYDKPSPSPVLGDEEAWDVAAFVCSQQRPRKLFAFDWPNISKKPVDLPFGPYADQFSESQHKYGPFAPIQAARTTAK